MTRYASADLPNGNVDLSVTMDWAWKMCCDVVCQDCSGKAPIDFCRLCRSEYEARHRLWLDRENAARRAFRARRRAARPQMSCDGCGKLFRPLRSDTHYCSHACRQRAYRRRLKPEA
jgi:hypothetical protein